jgi:hypothetical protein
MAPKNHRPSPLTVMGVADIILTPFAQEKGSTIAFNPIVIGDTLLEIEWQGPLLEVGELESFRVMGKNMLGVKVDLRVTDTGYEVVPVRAS